MANIFDLLKSITPTLAGAASAKPTTKYTGEYPKVKKYLYKGDKGSEVKKLQNYLNWYTCGKFFKKCGKADGIYGNNTLKYVKKMQTDFFGKKEADGTVGPKTIAKMKAYSDSIAPSPTPTGQSYPGAYPSINRKQKLIDKAVELAWPKGTKESKYKNPGGSATKAFTKALDKVYPNHKEWGSAPSKGASCDVFVGTCVRSAGLDSKYPRGLQEQFEYKPAAFDRTVYKNVAPIDKSKDGDIVMFDYGNGAHTVIRGNGYYYEANYPSYFGHTKTNISRLNNKFSTVVILRPRNNLKQGDSGSEVSKWQSYLDWYFDGKVGKADGVFGPNTKKWTVKFQEKEIGKGQGDGIVGSVTLKAAKAVKK